MGSEDKDGPPGLEEIENLAQGCGLQNSSFIIEIKDILKEIYKQIDVEASKKLTVKGASDFKHLAHRLFLKCAEADNRHNTYKLRIKSLEEQLEDKNKYLEQIGKNLDNLTKIIEVNTGKIDQLASAPTSGTAFSRPLIQNQKDEAPVLVIDTISENGALSFRDVLVKNKSNLGKHNIKDLIIPKQNRLIIKMNNQAELDNLQQAISKERELADLAQIKISKQRKNRLILFGVPPGLSDVEFIKEIESVENIEGHEIEIIKKFKNERSGNDNTNYIIDVDNYTKGVLLERGKIIINYNRIRIGNYVNITRCFRCQRYDHVAQGCKNRVVCGGCSGEHDTRECKNKDNEKCANCKTERHHRSDSKTCPTFAAYKKDKLNQNKDG